jgi:hypothetical protein
MYSAAVKKQCAELCGDIPSDFQGFREDILLWYSRAAKCPTHGHLCCQILRIRGANVWAETVRDLCGDIPSGFQGSQEDMFVEFRPAHARGNAWSADARTLGFLKKILKFDQAQRDSLQPKVPKRQRSGKDSDLRRD